jgi:lipoteichoic acid synthase
MSRSDARAEGLHTPWRRVRSLLLTSAPVLAVVVALTVKMLYFVRVVFPLPNDWSHPGYWLKGVSVATLSSFGTLLLVASLLFWLPPRARYVAAWCLDVLATLLIIADVLYLRFYSDILSVSAIADVGQVGMISESVLALLRPTDAVFFADILAAAILFPMYWRRVDASAVAWPRRRWLAGTSFLIGAMLTAIPVGKVLSGNPLSFMSHLKVRGAGRIGLLNYHAYDLLRERFIAMQRQAPTPSDSLRVQSFLASWQPSTGPSELFGAARGKNLILVMVESLEAFTLGLRVEGRDVTPNLNALAARSIVFDEFYSQAWRGATSDGEFTSLQSLHPLPDGAVPTLLTTQRFHALPQVMVDHGYHTISAHGGPGAMWSMRRIHQRYGIQRSHFFEDFRATQRLGMGLSDGAFFEQVLPLLARQQEPFAAYLVTLTMHHPYRLPRGYTRLDVGALEGTRIGGYLQSAHYFDEVFGEFLRQLDSVGLLDRSVLALYGDHPANYGEERALREMLARYTAYSPPKTGPDHHLWRADHRLAFLIRLPGGGHARRVTTPAGHLDVAPTLLDLLGIGADRMVGLGRNVLTDPRSLVAFRDGSFVKGDTLCVAASSDELAWCRDTRRGVDVPVASQMSNLAATKERLAVSDLLLFGDMIPWAATLQKRARP